MSSAPKAPGPFDDLTERELAILRLLASGHTIKTVATELGSTEASVNERLRDARRKTGASSSRELARLLNAQKIWNREIDLPSEVHGAEHRTAPRSDGRRTKGILAMLFIATIAAAGLIAIEAPHPRAEETATAVAAAPQEPMPLLGRWALDVSRIPEGERPQRVTFTFRAAPEQKLATHVEIVAKDGGVTTAETVAAVDGASVPIVGNLPIADTAALRRPAPNTLVMTFAKAGTPVSTRVYTVSKDRREMTETIVWDNDVHPRMVTTHFNRLD